MATEHPGTEVGMGGRSTDPKTAPQIPVLVELTHSRAFYDFDNEETGVRESRPYKSWTTTFRCRGWDRSTGRIFEFAGTVSELTVIESDPTREDREWLRNIGAI